MKTEKSSKNSCGHISCIWAPACIVSNEFTFQTVQEEILSINDKLFFRNNTEQSELNSLPPDTDALMSQSSTSHTNLSSGTLLSNTRKPIKETQHTVSLPSSPLPAPSPTISDIEMAYEESELGGARSQGLQGNPFTEDPIRHEAFERIRLIVANGDEGTSIEKNEDVRKFLIERLFPQPERGRGSRGGVRSYMCAFPGCGEDIPRRDRAINHVLIHFGARPYRCAYW
jgi:hypothetical protein